MEQGTEREREGGIGRGQTEREGGRVGERGREGGGEREGGKEGGREVREVTHLR